MPPQPGARIRPSIPTRTAAPSSAAIAGDIALEAAAHCAKKCVQVLGGIGFTWEHDAHFYLKRAMANLQLVTGGDIGELDHEVATLAVGGARRNLTADLPEEAEAFRQEIREVVATGCRGRRPAGGHRRGRADLAALARAVGPWGLAARATRHRRGTGGRRRPRGRTWPSGPGPCRRIIAHGTEEQQERWVRPTLLGQMNWCQLFSEPGAGSDLASLSTRADKVEGGYVLNGQKVWTSLAQIADFGICLARTDPDAPKHAGITYFIVDMHTEGLDIRPLRELTGAAMFNEVFFNDVFVAGRRGDRPARGRLEDRPDHAGQRARLHVLGCLLRQRPRVAGAQRHAPGRDRPCGSVSSLEGRLGHLIAEAQSVALLGHRSTLATLSGVDPGSGSSVRKLLGVEHEQRVQEMGMALYGAGGAVLDGKAQRWEEGFLSTRCLTIAGGTSEVQRNVIAERILGQPRDPEPGS